MPEKELEAVMHIRQMPFEEKIKMLSESDKDYVRGYIDRALYVTAQDKFRTINAKNEAAESTAENKQEVNEYGKQ